MRKIRLCSCYYYNCWRITIKIHYLSMPPPHAIQSSTAPRQRVSASEGELSLPNPVLLWLQFAAFVVYVCMWADQGGK